MVPFRLALFGPALLALLALGQGAAAQSSLAPTQGSLPPPRPANQAAPRLVPSEQPRSLTLPPSRPATPAQRQAAPRPTPSRTQAPARAQAPAQPSRAAPPRAASPSPSRATAAPPTVGRPTPPPSRRPAAAAAGAGAGAGAAAVAAAAASRAAEPGRPTPPPSVPSTGSVTGLALPRYAALRSDEVNMRVGPSTSYPIEWTFQRRDLPVQIIGEFQLWRRIRDADGAEGWVHSSTLAGRRTVLVRPATAQEATLRRRPEDAATAVARIRPGVIARIRECETGAPWCELQVAGHRGFLRRTELWGVGLEEEIK
ncbi:hypothetical protein HB662_07595 [Roseomonas frigidaquae]|uniref:SH3-like domain-containing protein n=1 Tax=Falsiroseomonas frigidaquae TaxID=487318 RepID=A0ABX1EX20_9PROT|nr:SH3 domain-containing protein [Falsiroseomonas frigidaquae]NKE44636.1 hypothetical protein [Falsiroseomonas frigidaquae]